MPVQQLRAVSLEQLRALEQLHLKLLTARFRNRAGLRIDAKDIQQYEDALKAAFPPFDFASHGFGQESK